MQIIIKGARTGIPAHLMHRTKHSIHRLVHAETWLVPSLPGL